MNEMTSSSRHRIQNSSPGGLRPITPPRTAETGNRTSSRNWEFSPLFADKSIQFPSILGDVKYIILMGGRHKAHLICGSGWGWVICEAAVFTSSRAVSTLDDHHIKRTRYDHQVSLVAIYPLQQRAYSIYSTESQGNTDSFEE